MSSLRRVLTGLIFAFVAMLSVSATAGAVTLTSTTGTLTGSCTDSSSVPEELIQTGSTGGVSYTVPAGGGVITSWSFNTGGATPGETYTLIVVDPSGGGYTVVASDTETVPSSPPAIETYTLATPIAAQAGDLIGVATQPGTNPACAFYLPGASADSVAVTTGSLTAGASLTPLGANTQLLANISVNLVQSEDAAITQTSTESSVTTGGTNAFLLSVSSTSALAPVAVTDSVPSGLAIDSVVASSGSCTTSGQIISCTGVNPPATIAVIVDASQAGQFTNNATVAATISDPDSANNSSSATLQVTSPVSATTSPAAVVATIRWSSLAKLPLSEARAVIRDLGLKVGKVTHKHSKSILKGEVISTSALTGHLVDVGATVSIVASSGKPAPKHH